MTEKITDIRQLLKRFNHNFVIHGMFLQFILEVLCQRCITFGVVWEEGLVKKLIFYLSATIRGLRR
jgi:hypothetical protein